MKHIIFKKLFLFLFFGHVCIILGVPEKTRADEHIKLYYSDPAQVELISPKGLRVLIDVCDPGKLSSPPTDKDVLLTTHSHGDHRRSDFVNSFPGQQLDMKIGEIKLEDVMIRGIASAHNEGLEFRPEGGSNYIFIVDMGGLRIAHFGDIGQDALTTEQLTALGKVDIAITQLSNQFSGMTATNKKGFNLMDQLKPKLIIPTHIFETTCIEIAAKKWDGHNSYRRYLSITPEDLSDETHIIFMGQNASRMKLPISNL